LKNFKKKIFFLLIGVCLGSPYSLNLQQINSENNPYTRDSHFSQVIGIMVDFQEDDNPATTGNGKFLSEMDITFIESDNSRCDGFIVDPPPHNKDYFESQIEAVRNYYNNISNGNFIFNAHVLDNVYSLSSDMASYSDSDYSIGELFAEGLELAKNDVELYLGENPQYDDILFVVFHAGVGQDVSFPYIDPTNYDIPSAYIEDSMLSTISSDSWISQNNINRGIVLPESLNHIYYDIIEDLFYGLDDYCDYQIGMTGLFALLVGYALDFPPLYNTDNGRAGVGIFGLMDYGSNNGYGVIPSPPSPWTLINKGWSSFNYSDVGENILMSDIHRIDIASDEFLIIQNRNNWVFNNIDLDSLRNKNKIWSDSFQDSIPGHFFDNLVENTGENVVISPNTGVILAVDNYDYGLPGSGIVIWHINESLIDINSLSSGINNNTQNKAIKIKEADGAMDIGFECYHWNPSFCNTLTRGWEYDMWFSGNDSYTINNPNQTEILLNDYSNPSSRSDLGALSLFQLDNFSGIQTEMSYRHLLNSSLNLSYISDNDINIIGAGVVDGSGCIFYSENSSYYKYCFGQDIENIDDMMQDNSVVLVYNNQIYFSDLNSYVDMDGNLQSGLNNLGVFGYINSTEVLDESLEGVSLGDFDRDGLDEVVTIGDNYLDIKNQNDTSIDYFPIQGDFDSVVLIANILDINSEQLELIVKSGNSINIINMQGDILYSIASNDGGDLRLVPWGDNIALIDGNRMFLFEYDEDRIYWSSRYGTDWNYPMSSPDALHQSSALDLNNNLINFYNYPNPVRNGLTTFRFLYSAESMNPIINIYNVDGELKDIIEPVLFNYQLNEFNEIDVSLNNYNTGVYFAELRDGNKSLGFVKVAVIK